MFVKCEEKFLQKVSNIDYANSPVDADFLFLELEGQGNWYWSQEILINFIDMKDLVR